MLYMYVPVVLDGKKRISHKEWGGVGEGSLSQLSFLLLFVPCDFAMCDFKTQHC